MLERGWQCTVKGGCSDIGGPCPSCLCSYCEGEETIGAAKTPEGDLIDVLCPHCDGISRYGKRRG
jgi:hypothetical protein